MERVIDHPTTHATPRRNADAAPIFRPADAASAMRTPDHRGGIACEVAQLPAPLRWHRTDESAARRTLRAQIVKLERELASLAALSRPYDEIDWSIRSPAPRGPRLLSLGELERVRDDLAERLNEVRVVHAERAAREALKRDQLARLLHDPAEHRFVRITRADVGEPGCGAWESRPRLGLIGMLAGWWHVKISSGCPLSSR